MVTDSSRGSGDILRQLWMEECSDPFHFMAAADFYVARAAAPIRRAIPGMLESHRRREQELAGLIIEADGALPSVPVLREAQYMAYLSLGHLICRLLVATEQSILRYERAIAGMGELDGVQMLRSHLVQLKEEAIALRAAGAHEESGFREPDTHHSP